MLVEPSLHNVFFADYLDHKTINKVTCTTPSANPNQLCAH